MSEPSPLPLSGTLEVHSWLSLLSLAAASQATGLFELTLPDRQLTVHLRKGSVDHVESNHFGDDLGEILIQRRLLTAEQRNQAVSAAAQFDGQILGALFGLGLVNSNQILPLLSTRALSILTDAAGAESGTFLYTPGELAGHPAMPVGERWPLLSELVRRMPIASVHFRLKPFLKSSFRKAKGRVNPAELGLNAQETRLVTHLSAASTLEAILKTPGLDSENFLRVTYLLKETTHLLFDAPETTDDLASLKSQLAKMAKLDHFHLLEISEMAAINEVRSAYFKAAKLYHPDTVPPQSPREMVDVKSEIFSLIGEAYRTLSNPETRQAYLLKLNGAQPAEVDISAVLGAEDKFRKACALVKTRKLAEAVTLLDELITLQPQEGEYYAWRGYARYLTVPDKVSAHAAAFKDFKQAIEKNPKCAQAYYFMGQVEKLSGKLEVASKYFAQTVELQPAHIEAQREIRLLSQRK